jgi:tetratricopeptide (TPR) repeat protein
MTNSLQRRQAAGHLRKPALSTAAALLIACAFAGPAIAPVAVAQDAEAQQSEEKKDRASERSERGSRSAASASDRARKRKDEQQAKPGEEPAPMYPQATRTDPKIRASNKGGKHLNAMLKDFEAKKFDDVLTKAQALPADANAYDKSFAYQLAANAAVELDKQDLAVEYYQKAIDSNGLDNNGHYMAMYNMAIVQNQRDKHAESLAAVDRFLTETKSDKPEAIAFKAYLLSVLERPGEAAALYERILKDKPDDKATLMNAVSLYQQAGNSKRVDELMKIAREKNMLTDHREYRMLYVGLINAGKFKDALALIDEGIAKGAIKPSQTLASDYQVIAQTAYGEENTALAIDMYKRADQASTDGEAALNLARVLRNENRIGEAKQAAQRALDKGVKKPDDAKKILGLSGK